MENIVNYIMIYISIGMSIMYYVVNISKELQNDSFDFFQSASLLNLFLVGLVWPFIVMSAIIFSIIDYLKYRKEN